jgi:hypothetical protein
MRSDMSKVIVERPRRRIPLKGMSAYPRGQLKNRWAPNLEDAPRTESMGGTYADKRLNENLQPLVRFLRSCVGRRWDEVHSEMASQISCRSAVQKHVLDHLRDYVVQTVWLERGVPYCKGWRGPEALTSWGMRFRFYVEPGTRILRLAPFARRKGRRGSEADPDRRVLSGDRELRRVAGVWYEIGVAPIPRDQDAGAFDVLERSWTSSRRDNVLWRTGRYAASKRQLSAREIVRAGLKR